MVDATHNNRLEMTLPDELILSVLSYADANDLVAFQQTCRRYQNFSKSNDLWRDVYRRRWQASWPYSTLSSNNEEDTDLFRALAIDEEWGNWTWKERYQWAQGDLLRTEITLYELEGLKWDSTFLVPLESNSVVYFYQGRICEHERNTLFRKCQLRMVDDESDIHYYFRQGLEAAFEEPLRQALRRAVKITGGASISRCSLRQYLNVNGRTQFPNYIGRTSVGNWLLRSFNEVLFSVGVPQGEEIPEQLQAVLDSQLAEVW